MTRREKTPICTREKKRHIKKCITKNQSTSWQKEKKYAFVIYFPLHFYHLLCLVTNLIH